MQPLDLAHRSTRLAGDLSRRTLFGFPLLGGLLWAQGSLPLRGGLARAQGTPPPPSVNPAPAAGITVVLLGHGTPLDAPGKDLELIRITFAPGGYAGEHHHPGANVFYVESGVVQYDIVAGTVTVTRATGATPAASTPAPTEKYGPGAAITLRAGDALFYDRTVTHTVRNAGTEPAVVYASTLLALGQPDVIFGPPPATPGA